MLKTPEITEEQGGGSAGDSAEQGLRGEQNMQSVQTRVKDRFLGHHEGEFTPSKGASGSGHNVETPIRSQEIRSIGKPQFRPIFRIESTACTSKQTLQSIQTSKFPQTIVFTDARTLAEGGGEGASSGASRAGELGGWSYTTHLRGPLHHGAEAGAPRTLDNKSYIPFAGGFANMASEAAVYRSARLHGINPTAAVTEDISFYYTLDSGRVPPAAIAANPESAAEFVRNTPRGTHGGLFRSLMKPIE